MNLSMEGVWKRYEEGRKEWRFTGVGEERRKDEGWKEWRVTERKRERVG